jgi:hypothetical protein
MDWPQDSSHETSSIATLARVAVHQLPNIALLRLIVVGRILVGKVHADELLMEATQRISTKGGCWVPGKDFVGCAIKLMQAMPLSERLDGAKDVLDEIKRLVKSDHKLVRILSALRAHLHQEDILELYDDISADDYRSAMQELRRIVG